MTRISAILLAAGLSQRMGGPNKLLLPFREEKLIQKVYHELSQSEADEIIVVTGRDQQLVSESLSLRSQDRFVHNPSFETGMTSSIQAGVEVATGQAYMLCLGDMPLISTKHYNDLIERFRTEIVSNSSLILTIKANGMPGNPVMFSEVYKQAIMSHDKPNGCKQIVQDNKHQVLFFNTHDEAYTRDIDTQEDYNRWER